MTATETQKVKLAAQSLLKKLMDSQPKVLVQDWYKDVQSHQSVKRAVEEVLDLYLPDSYDRVLFQHKCETIFNLIYTRASKG